MSEKAVTPKTTTLAQATKKLAVRKTPAKKAPAAKAAAPKVLKTVSEQEKKTKKAKDKGSKMKVIRDSFTMPQSDYAKIGELKQLCLKSGMHVKKSELLRAGLHALGKLSTAQLKIALFALEKIDTGRPKK